MYMDSTDPLVICGAMLEDATTLVNERTLEPTTGLRGHARRGGFWLGIGNGPGFRFVGLEGGATFGVRFGYCAEESDPVEAFSSRLQIDLESCLASPEWAELGPRCILASQLALEALPDSASDLERAKAVFGAYHEEVERHEHEAVWKSTFKAPGLFHTG